MVRDFVGRDVDEDRLAAEVVRRTAEEEEEEDPPRCSVGVRVLATANCSPRWRTAERETRSDCGGWRVADWLRGMRGDGSRLRMGWTAREGRFVVDHVGDTAHTVVVVVVVAAAAERLAASSPALRGAFRRRVVEAGRVASGVRRRRAKAVAALGQRCSRTERRFLRWQQRGPFSSRLLLMAAVLAGAAADSAVLFRGQR